MLLARFTNLFGTKQEYLSLPNVKYVGSLRKKMNVHTMNQDTPKIRHSSQGILSGSPSIAVAMLLLMIIFRSGIGILMGGLPNHLSKRAYWKGKNLFTNMQKSNKILSLNLIQMRETTPYLSKYL
jgi:hypothetical protein